MKPLRFSLQAGNRVGRTGIESVAHEKVHYRTTPSWWKAKTTLIVDAALLLSEGNTGHVFTHSDAEGESRIESQPVVRCVDLREPELYLEVQGPWSRLREYCLPYRSRPGRIEGGDTHVIEIAPSLGTRKERPHEFHGRIY